MRRTLWLLTTMLLLAFGMALCEADILVTRDGHQIETDGPWKVKGRQVIFTTPKGQLSSIRLSEVDLEASELATNPPPPLPPPPPAPPAEKVKVAKKPVMTFTNKNIAHATSECEGFPDMLESCTPYTCQFTHPFFGESMKRQIIAEGEKCKYVEQMPDNLKLECLYPKADLKTIAQFYRDMFSPGIKNIQVDFSLSDGKSAVTHTVDGKEVRNPLQEASDSGVCRVYETESD